MKRLRPHRGLWLALGPRSWAPERAIEACSRKRRPYGHELSQKGVSELRHELRERGRLGRLGRVVAISGCLALVPIVLNEPIALALGQMLEERFPTEPILPAEVYGIIILGGDLEYHSTGHNTVIKSARIAAAIPLSSRFGNARIVLPGCYQEAVDGPSMLVAAGISGSRIVTETQAKNTWENAMFTRALMGSEGKAPWILITSALHMPRAVGAFRRAGFNVIAVPTAPLAPETLVRVSFNEAFALFFYRVSRRSDAFFSAPLPF